MRVCAPGLVASSCRDAPMRARILPDPKTVIVISDSEDNDDGSVNDREHVSNSTSMPRHPDINSRSTKIRDHTPYVSRAKNITESSARKSTMHSNVLDAASESSLSSIRNDFEYRAGPISYQDPRRLLQKEEKQRSFKPKPMHFSKAPSSQSSMPIERSLKLSRYRTSEQPDLQPIKVSTNISTSQPSLHSRTEGTAHGSMKIGSLNQIAKGVLSPLLRLYLASTRPLSSIACQDSSKNSDSHSDEIPTQKIGFESTDFRHGNVRTMNSVEKHPATRDYLRDSFVKRLAERRSAKKHIMIEKKVKDLLFDERVPGKPLPDGRKPERKNQSGDEIIEEPHSDSRMSEGHQSENGMTVDQANGYKLRPVVLELRDIVKHPVTREEFKYMRFETINSLCERDPPNIFLRSLSIDDITSKALEMYTTPKNIKITPRRNPTRFQDQTDLLTRVVANGSPSNRGEPSDSVFDETSRQPFEVSVASWKQEHDGVVRMRYRKIRPSKAQAEFLKMFDLSCDAYKKRPLKRDVLAALRTRKRIKDYVVNPSVNILKAHCIFKYAIEKEKMTPNDLRIKYHKIRERSAGSKKLSLGPYPSWDVDAPAIKEISNHSLPSTLRKISNSFSSDGVWTSFADADLLSKIQQPVITLIEAEDPSCSKRKIRSTQCYQKHGFECEQCNFRCLNSRSMLAHTRDFHRRTLC